MPDSIVNNDLSQLAIYMLTGVLVVLIVSACVVLGFAVRKDAVAVSKSMNEFFSNNNTLKLFTVVCILISATFLALVGQLSNGIIALLSSISGYVLGSLQSEKTKLSKKDGAEG